MPLKVKAVDASGNETEIDLLTADNSPTWTNLTLQNGFAVSSVSNACVPAYSKSGKQVYLRGLLQRSTTGLTSGAIIATLPAGLAPLKTERFAYDPNLLGGYVEINSSGQISYGYTSLLGALSSVTISLSGINFWLN